MRKRAALASLLLAATAQAGGLGRPNTISARGVGMGGAWVAFVDDASGELVRRDPRQPDLPAVVAAADAWGLPCACCATGFPARSSVLMCRFTCSVKVS